MSTLTFNPAPQRVCLLRLSAIGDTCHAAAALRALQTAWPKTHFTWIIGKVEAKLMSAVLPDVEFITFDKRAMLAELLRLRALLRPQVFDLLIDLQLSIRASAVSTLVRAPLKLGFDRARARELQWLFTNRQIAPAQHEHVLDSFLGFVRACGLPVGEPRWDVQLPPDSLQYAASIVTDARPTLLISPCSSHSLRNWDPKRYASIADHAAGVHGMRVVLVGGRSGLERRTGDAILGTAKSALLDQIGKDTLPQLLGLMSRSTLLLSPDSGPAHMAAMVALPVLGLYAATRTARVGPYLSRQWCVDHYAQAAEKFEGKPATELPWTLKIERPGVMDLIEVAEVAKKLDDFMANHRKMPV
jgi:heptosyltransferase I